MNLDIYQILKIAVFGIMLAVIDKILESVGKKEIATMVSIIGLVIILIMTIGYISNLFRSLITMFQL
ncbi:MAG: stage III sporulation protein AC [Clostridiales bacterium]|nr:stage III sporulation protein AC [Clostridiales bacterium]